MRPLYLAGPLFAACTCIKIGDAVDQRDDDLHGGDDHGDDLHRGDHEGDHEDEKESGDAGERHGQWGRQAKASPFCQYYLETH